MGWLLAIGKAAVWLLNLFWTKPAVSAEQRLGREEAKNENLTQGLDEVRTAVEARDRSDASSAGRVLDGSDPAAGAYRPGPD